MADFENHEVTIKGTSPLVLLPLGVFSDRPDSEQAQYERALFLYRREDGEMGFPAGGISSAVIESCKDLDKTQKVRVVGGFHVIGEEETNLVRVIGQPRMETFGFKFKKPLLRELLMPLPKFDEWRIVFQVQIHEDLKLDEFKAVLEDAGKNIGIGHRRPEMGKFEVEKIS
jgi:hypothetical protein